MADGLAAVLLPFARLFDLSGVDDLFVGHRITVDWGYGAHVPGWGELVAIGILGVVLLFATLHLVRALGQLQGQLAKHLLVASAAR